MTRLLMAEPRVAEPYYRGTRFDRTGIILSLESGGHRYVQPWQRHYDPFSHDAVSGPAEEFLPVFPDAGILKIGVGLLKDDGEPYDRFKLYEVLDPGQMTIILGKNTETGATGPVSGVTQPQRSEDGRSRTRSLSAGPEPSDTGPSAITFRHFLDGYYDYEKLVEIPAEGRLRLSHKLTNHSTLPFDTYVYCHNFFILDGAPTGRATRFTFPFRPVGDWRAPYDSVRLSDRGIVFDRDLRPDETVFMGNLRPAITNETQVSLPLPEPVGVSAKMPRNAATPATPCRGNDGMGAGYRFSLLNLENKLCVEAACDRAMDHAVFWSNSDVSCLEPYVPLHLAPGQTARWTLDYRFLF